MRIERALVEDEMIYDIMYFSPIKVGEERHQMQLYFETPIYYRKRPTSMMEKMSAQIDQLRHVELGIHPFDQDFKARHCDMVLFHEKMSLAYLDAREARIARILCLHGKPATQSTEPRIQQDEMLRFDFLRIIMLSVQSCSARRVKFYPEAIEALTEAKEICLQEARRVHPLLTALTLLNLSAVLGDIDHDEHGLRWGLEALSMMYDIFRTIKIPEVAQAYYLALACHNAALLNMKLLRWGDAVELVNEGIEFTKQLKDDDGLRDKLISIGAQAKHVPEGFLKEAVNALNGWGDDNKTWNLSFWDFSVHEISEEIRVLEKTETLEELIIDHMQDISQCKWVQDAHLLKFILAATSCQSLQKFTICNIDFNPRKVWQRLKKPSFLEHSWYAASPMNYILLGDAKAPEVGEYEGLLTKLDAMSKKLVLFLVVLGNQCDGIDLSCNGLDCHQIVTLVTALRSLDRPDFAHEVTTLILRDNCIDDGAASELARTWLPKEPLGAEITVPKELLELGPGGLAVPVGLWQRDPTVTSLDISENKHIGDRGFDALTMGLAHYQPFNVLTASCIGLGPEGCVCLERLQATSLERLCLSRNAIKSEGAKVVCKAAMSFKKLHSLELESCEIDEEASEILSELVAKHETLTHVCVSRNQLGDEGVITLCAGASQSSVLSTLRMTYNGICSCEAAGAIGQMMRLCRTLREINISGNTLDPAGAPRIGAAIEHSKVLKMYLEDMSFNETSIDDFLDHGAAESQDLQVMILNNNPVGDDGLGIIAECLSIGLTELSLSNCGLTSSSQATLLNLVSLSPNLESLNLSHNNLGPLGCSDMVQWMTQNEKEQFSLRSLELAGCGLGDEGLYQLVPILGSLTHLGARSNGITSSGLEAVMNKAPLIQLQTFDLADNQIGELGVHALTERFQQEHKKSLWNPKQLTSTIDKIILSNNQIDEALAMSTECFLKIHNPLLKVDWYPCLKQSARRPSAGSATVS